MNNNLAPFHFLRERAPFSHFFLENTKFNINVGDGSCRLNVLVIIVEVGNRLDTDFQYFPTLVYGTNIGELSPKSRFSHQYI